MIYFALPASANARRPPDLLQVWSPTTQVIATHSPAPSPQIQRGGRTLSLALCDTERGAEIVTTKE